MSINALVAIPVYNEQVYLDAILERTRPYCSSILVIDDGSTDDTPLLLGKYSDIHVITHPENRGYGMSLASAFAFARRGSYDWLITLDARRRSPQMVRILARKARPARSRRLNQDLPMPPGGPSALRS